MTKTATPEPIDTEELGNPLDFHAEVYESTLTHEEILVGCWCPIGRTHTYAEAVA
ncbi:MULTISPECIES: hypothetical protein [unclassified Leifsonia]|uniref:hypothetical protein n=1 Tax=unclassified Leifsonia TaxID=2663824 RepID=UPI000AACF111|nr:hypothetical protein [Leifsonia sp. 71-9]